MSQYADTNKFIEEWMRYIPKAKHVAFIESLCDTLMFDDVDTAQFIEEHAPAIDRKPSLDDIFNALSAGKEVFFCELDDRFAVTMEQGHFMWNTPTGQVILTFDNTIDGHFEVIER